MTKKLANIFGPYKEAVIAVKDGYIVYYNGAASKLIPNIEKLKPEDIFPLQLLEHHSSSFVGDADVSGHQAVVAVSRLEEYRIFSIITPDSENQNGTGNLLSSVSTELKNMLSVLKMASGLLLPYIENIGNPRLNRYAAMIYHSYYSMLRLTNNVSDLGNFLRNDIVMERTSFDVIAMCRDMISSTQHLMNESSVELNFKSKHDSLFIYADNQKFEKMLLNLLSNSLSNTPAGGSLTLSAVTAGDRLVITVSDTGDGIPGEVLATAWNRYNVPREMIDPDSGIGLGLTIVSNIARMHGGSAVLESRPGEGTTVTVSIPIQMEQATKFKTNMVSYDSASMQQLLTELSSVISYDKYTQLYMD